MRYYIHCNQKKLNPHHLSAIEEYAKRLSAYCTTSLILSTSLKLPDSLSGEKHTLILVKAGSSSYTSEEFAEKIGALQLRGVSNVHILVGFTEAQLFEALPPDETLPSYAAMCVSRCSLSDGTCSLLIFEQLYRSYTILSGKTYHK